MDLRKLTVATVLFAAQVVCAEPAQRLDVTAIWASGMTAPQKAEALAKIGERLMMRTSLPYAIEVFDDALRYDPNNVRAKVFAASLRPLKAMKGILARVRPAVVNTQEPLALKSFDESVARQGNSITAQYLKNADGLYLAQNEEHLQNIVNEVSQSLVESRRILGENLNASFEATLPVVSEQMNDKATCTVTRTDGAPGRAYIIGACSNLKYAKIQISMADIQAIVSGLTGQLIVNALTTSWNANGVNQAIAQAEAKEIAKRKLNRSRRGGSLDSETITALNRDVSARGLFSILTKEGAGGIKSTESLKYIEGLGVDLLAGVSWIAKMQKSLCAAGQLAELQRNGQIFSSGICLTSKDFTKRQLKTVLSNVAMTLDRQNINVFHGVAGEASTGTVMNFSKIYLQPVNDLRNVFPSRFTADGRVAELKDKTLGGVYVNGDAETAMRIKKNK